MIGIQPPSVSLREPPPPPARRRQTSGLGSVLVTHAFNQNLVSIVFCSFHEVKGRYASALDIIERAAPCSTCAPPVWGSQGFKRSGAKWPLMASNRLSKSMKAFGEGTAVTKALPDKSIRPRSARCAFSGPRCAAGAARSIWRHSCMDKSTLIPAFGIPAIVSPHLVRARRGGQPYRGGGYAPPGHPVSMAHRITPLA
jgi:hypothetical protein